MAKTENGDDIGVLMHSYYTAGTGWWGKRKVWVQRGYFEGDIGVFIGGIDQGVPKKGM